MVSIRSYMFKLLQSRLHRQKLDVLFPLRRMVAQAAYVKLKTVASPSGLGLARPSDISVVSTVLSVCNPVTVSQDVLLCVKNMISISWPHATDDAKSAIPAFADLYQKVKSHNLPNCLGARIHVHSGLNIINWAAMLKEYHDNELCQFLTYGWPLGFYSQTPPETVPDNHPSAINFPEHVREFIATEIKHKALEVISTFYTMDTYLPPS